MKLVSDFFPRILPYVPGCSEPMAAQALVDSAIAFCEESLAVRESLSAFSTVAATPAYTLAPPANQLIARVTAVWVDGSLVAPISAADSPLVSPGTSIPAAYYTTRVDSALLLVLTPTPDKAYQIVAEVALKPTRSALSVQDDLYDRWVEGVVAGALGRLLVIPNQPFSNPPAGTFYSSSALQSSRKARVESGSGRVQSSRRIQPRAFA